jgi:hypothetical protein
MCAEIAFLDVYVWIEADIGAEASLQRSARI